MPRLALTKRKQSKVDLRTSRRRMMFESLEPKCLLAADGANYETQPRLEFETASSEVAEEVGELIELQLDVTRMERPCSTMIVDLPPKWESGLNWKFDTMT